MRWLATAIGLLVLLVGLPGPITTAAPELAVVFPTNQAQIHGTSLTVTFAVNDIAIVRSPVARADFGSRGDANRRNEGHVLISLDMWPMVVWDRAEPYTFPKEVPPGEHIVRVELVNNDHSSLAPPIVQEVRFLTTADVQLPNVQKLPNLGASPVPESEPALLVLAALLMIAGGLALRRRQA